MCYSEQGGNGMQKYEKPIVEIVEIMTYDVITLSFEQGGNGQDVENDGWAN